MTDTKSNTASECPDCGAGKGETCRDGCPQAAQENETFSYKADKPGSYELAFDALNDMCSWLQERGCSYGDVIEALRELADVIEDEKVEGENDEEEIEGLDE